MHIKHCLTSAKAIPIHEVQKLLCVDAAASDAENLCMWCLASPLNIFWESLLQKSLEQLCKTNKLTKQRFINHIFYISKIIYLYLYIFAGFTHVLQDRFLVTTRLVWNVHVFLWGYMCVAKVTSIGISVKSMLFILTQSLIRGANQKVFFFTEHCCTKT